MEIADFEATITGTTIVPYLNLLNYNYYNFFL